MQELGVWSTASGTTRAILELDADDSSVGAAELPNWASGALKGALAGAATGASAGPYGALIGAATGGVLGAASSAATPASAASATASSSGAKDGGPGAASGAAGANRAKVVQGLQQFAAIIPTLVQLVAVSGQGGKEFTGVPAEEGRGTADDSDWGPESFEGSWTVP